MGRPCKAPTVLADASITLPHPHPMATALCADTQHVQGHHVPVWHVWTRHVVPLEATPGSADVSRQVSAPSDQHHSHVPAPAHTTSHVCEDLHWALVSSDLRARLGAVDVACFGALARGLCFAQD